MQLVLGSPTLKAKSREDTKLLILLSIYSYLLMVEVLGLNTAEYMRQKHSATKDNIEYLDQSLQDLQKSSLMLLALLLLNIVNTGCWIKNQYRVMNFFFFFVHCSLVSLIIIDSCNLPAKVANLLTLNQFIVLICSSILLSTSPMHSFLAISVALYKCFYLGPLALQAEDIV
jgi:hypothetical protein